MGEPIVEWLNQQQDNMVELLRDLVDIDSNSFDKVPEKLSLIHI